jgi:hypothetical protein
MDWHGRARLAPVTALPSPGRRHGPTLPGILAGFLAYGAYLVMVWLVFTGVLALADLIR